MIFNPIHYSIGLRYVRAQRSNKFVSFISLASMIGIALGVMVLITVISVMNGFSKEIRAKMLSVAPHLTIDSENGLDDWEQVRNLLVQYDNVKGALPYIDGVGMVVGNGKVTGVQVKGIKPSYVNDVFPLEDQLSVGTLQSLNAGKYNIILGDDLAMQLRVNFGEKISIIAPEAQVTIGGIIPRIKQFTVSGIFHSGTPFDKHGAFIDFTDAGKIYRQANRATGIQLKLTDELMAPELTRELRNLPELYGHNIYDWTMIYSDFFDAIKMEKRVMWCILVLIIAVAAFNLVSSLVMLVTDKRGDIAVLRTIGLSRRKILLLFITTGMVIGTCGTFAGLISGIILAKNAGFLVSQVESLFGMNFISENVYFIGYLPSEIYKMDVVIICVASLLLSFIATIYPAYKASNVHPAEALKNER